VNEPIICPECWNEVEYKEVGGYFCWNCLKLRQQRYWSNISTNDTIRYVNNTSNIMYGISPTRIRSEPIKTEKVGKPKEIIIEPIKITKRFLDF